MSITTPAGLTRSWKEGDSSCSIALCSGGEILGLDQCTDRFVKFARDNDWEVVPVEAKGLDRSALRDALAQVSLFAVQRMFVLRGLPPTDAMEEIVDIIMAAPDLVLVIRHDGNVDKRLRWVKKLKKSGAIFSFETIQERDMPERISGLAESMKLKISFPAVRALAARVGTDLAGAKNELEKLALFLHPATSVSLEDVEALVGRSRETILYEITEGIRMRDAERALADLGDLLKQGTGAGGILALIAREVRFLIQAQDLLRREPRVLRMLQNYQQFGTFLRSSLDPSWKSRYGEGRENVFRQHPYVLFLRMQQAKDFPSSKLRHILASLGRADRSIKWGLGRAETVLYATVAAAAGGRTS